LKNPSTPARNSARLNRFPQAEIDNYLAGSGMGYAKAAELNHYPGPKHVLELASELDLDEQQLARTQEIFLAMQKQAVELGRQLVDHESELDRLFASGEISTYQLEDRLAEIGALQAKIRFVHLATHLEQKDVLSEKQVMQYDRLRGYANGHSAHKH
jgi:Spy/CpxP family protein refolding chaperone